MKDLTYQKMEYKTIFSRRLKQFDGFIIITIISLLKIHVRRTCLHNKNITNETHK